MEYIPVRLVPLMAACIFATPIATTTISAEDRPNIVLIMADDLGYECLTCNGGTSYPTPVFDKIAKQGMRFTNCYSQPVCTPSRNKIMTGRSNARNYIKFGVLDKNEVTFGTLMKNAGYKTAVAGKWQLTGGGGRTDVDGPGTWPDRCGFDEHCLWAYDRDITKAEADDYYSTFPKGMKKKISRFWYPGIIENNKFIKTTMNDYGPDIYSKYLLDFIERNQKEPFFAYYPMVLTHNPFVPTPDTPNFPEADKLKGNNKYFGDMVRYTGKLVKQFLDKLDELGLAENTIVMFTGDNGTHRVLTSYMGDKVVLGGKAFPIDAGVHVPMLAWWKGKIAPGSTCTDLIEFSDFVPTIVEAGKGKLPTDRIIDGRSFLARLKGERYQARNTIFVHYDKSGPASKEPDFRRVRFAYNGRYKLYLDGTFFDIEADYNELSPLDVTKLDSKTNAIRIELRKTLDSMPKWDPDNSYFKGQPDSEMQKRLLKLKSLGITANAR